VPTLYLVRHAEPAALWGAHPDPGLSPLGHEQARAVGERLRSLDLRSLITSPLARCQETAAPLADMLGQSAMINNAVAEIPVPALVDNHRAWLTAVMSGAWDDGHVDASLRVWRENIGKALLALPEDTIVFSHFVAINAAVGLASNSDMVTCFKPGHASVTILASDNSKLSVIELGQESAIQLA
jgi:broad specificity phosphatase PhoE